MTGDSMFLRFRLTAAGLPALLLALVTAESGVAETATVRGAQPESSIPDGALFQVILEVADMGRQIRFYRDTLGLRLVEPAGDVDAAGVTFARFQTKGASFGLHAGRSDASSGATVRLSFMAADIVARRKALLEAGVPMAPIRHPADGVLVTDGRDPEGNVFHIESRVAASREPETVVAEVAKTLDAWVDAYNARQMDGFLALYADDARFHIHEHGRLLYGSKQQVADGIRSFYGTVARASFEVARPNIAAVSDNLALVATSYQQEIVLADGTMTTFAGTMHLVMQRRSDGWKILAGDTIGR